MAVWSSVDFAYVQQTLRLDAEYYRPEYLRLNRLVAGPRLRPWGDLEGKFIVGPFGSALTVNKYIEVDGYRYVRGRDVKPFVLLSDDNVYIGRGDFARLARYALEPGDLLISVVGTLGNVAVVDEDLGKAIFSCKSTAYRSSDLDPDYLCAYLNSSVGQACLERQRRGAVQTGLNLDDLKTIPVYLPTPPEREAVGALVRRSRQVLAHAMHHYSQAEASLLREFGLDHVDLSMHVCHETRFSDLSAAYRWDAEYYQAKYQRVIEVLSAREQTRLGALCTVTKGTEVGSEAYADEGKLFLRVSTLTPQGVREGPSEKYIAPDLFDQLAARYQPRKGEILLTKDGTPGIAYHLDEEIEAVTSSGIVRLQICDSIHPEYLTLTINSLACQLLIERDLSGALITHWKPAQIKQLPVPRLHEPRESEFGELVTESKRLGRHAEALLEQAKQMVEEMIEEEAKR